MPINAHPDFLEAEKKYLEAQTDEQKIKALEEMISKAPSHKGAENLRAQLKTRLKKLKEKIIRSKKLGHSTIEPIKKGYMQVVLIGFTNTGKSSLLKSLTRAEPKIAEYEFTTKKPEIGTLKYQDVDIQLIEIPSIGNENFNIGLVNSSDLILITVTQLEQIPKIIEQIPKAKSKKIVLFNKSDLLDKNQKRKISETLRSKKYNFILTSAKNQENIDELKEKIFQHFPLIRIYLKEPGQPVSTKPLIVKPNSTIKDIARKISSSFINSISEIHLWGPSSKFPNQKIGLSHKLKDKDIVEFKTR
jgi:uncharacterized protein